MASSPASPPLKSRPHRLSSLSSSLFPFSLSLSTLLSLFATITVALFALYTTTALFYTSHASFFPSTPPPFLPSTYIKPIDLSSLSSDHHDVQSPLLAFPPTNAQYHCVNVVPVDAPTGDPDPFNSRSFCAHARPICVTGRTTERAVGILHLSQDDLLSSSSSSSSCHASTPALRAPTTQSTIDRTINVSHAFPIKCDGLACAVRCAHGAQDVLKDEFPTCAQVVAFTDNDQLTSAESNNTSNALKREWLPSDDEILVVVPAYPFQGNIFHFAQTVVPLFHSASTLFSSSPSSSSSTATNPNITLLFRGNLPTTNGLWQSAVFDAMLTHSGLRSRIRSVDTFREDDLSLVRGGFIPSSALSAGSPPLGRTLCSRGGALLLGHRTHVNMWPFPGGNRTMFWPFNDNPLNTRVVPLTVPAIALHVRAAVYTEVELPGKRLLDHLLRKATLRRFVRSYVVRMRRKGKTLPGSERSSGVGGGSGKGGGKWGRGTTWGTWFNLLFHPSYRHALDELHTMKRLENDPDFDRLMRDAPTSKSSSSSSSESHTHGLPLTRRFFHAPLTRRPRAALLDLPGRVLVYARRDPISTRRAFCCGSASWVDNMLSRVASRHGFSIRTVDGGGGVSFAVQLAQMSDAGVVVGIHGANLVNTMFAPPLAALVEVANMHMQCYVGGMNAGLAYWLVKPESTATRRQSGCEVGRSEKEIEQMRMGQFDGGGDGVGGGAGSGRIEGVLEKAELCLHNPTWRAVRLGRYDRLRMERSVTQAVQYVLALHGAFAETVGAVPVVYKSDGSDEYEIDWSRASV